MRDHLQCLHLLLMALIEHVSTVDLCSLIHDPLSKFVVFVIDSCSLFLLGWKVKRSRAHWIGDLCDALELNWSLRPLDCLFLFLHSIKK